MFVSSVVRAVCVAAVVILMAPSALSQIVDPGTLPTWSVGPGDECDTVASNNGSESIRVTVCSAGGENASEGDVELTLETTEGSTPAGETPLEPGDCRVVSVPPGADLKVNATGTPLEEAHGTFTVPL